MAEVVNRDDIDVEESPGTPDNTQQVIGSTRLPVLQDDEGRFITRSRGARNLENTRFTLAQNIDEDRLALRPDDPENAKALLAVSVKFAQQSDAIVRVKKVDLENPSFTTNILERQLDNIENVFFQPDNRLELSPKDTIEVEVPQKTGEPSAFATLLMEDV